MTRKHAVQFVVVRSLGNFLLLLSLYGVFATFGPVILAETEFRIAQARGVTFQIAGQEIASSSATSRNDKGSPGFSDVLAGDTQQILKPKDTDFSILIPKINANATVIPNVDPINENDYLSALQKGVAHAKGTVFPGIKGTTYLFAHSADNWWDAGRYNAVFYLLIHLKAGDEIVVFFEGRRYNYVVEQTLTANPEDITFLTQAQNTDEQLVLQTCWPPGTAWKRFYVIAKPK